MTFDTRRKPLRLFTLLLTLLILLSIAMFQFNSVRPDFYQPVRPSLTEAKRHLSTFYANEKLLLKELSETQ